MKFLNIFNLFIFFFSIYDFFFNFWIFHTFSHFHSNSLNDHFYPLFPLIYIFVNTWMFSGMSLIFGEVWRVEDVLVSANQPFLSSISVPSGFSFSTTLGSRSLLGFLRPTLPAAPNETEPGSKTLVASLWEQLYLKITYSMSYTWPTRLEWRPFHIVSSSIYGLKPFDLSFNTSDILTISGRHQSRGICLKTCPSLRTISKCLF